MGTINNQAMTFVSTASRRVRSIIGKPSCNIVVACMPKSGSTYLSGLLSQCTGFDDLLLNEMIDGGQQELSKPRLKRSIGFIAGSVSHIHLRANAHNLKLIKQFQLKPIVLTRNLFDVVPSMADHFRRENTSGVLNIVPRDWGQMNDEKLYDFIIHNCLPWYLGFLFSWLDVSDEIETCWMTYEQLFSDQVQSVKKMLDFVGVPKTETAIQQAISDMQGKVTRLNKGVAGRGKRLLLPRQIETIQQIARSWGKHHPVLETIGIDIT